MTGRSTSTLDPATGEMTGEQHPLADTGKEAGERAGQLVERGADIGFKQADQGLQQAASGVETVAESIRRVSTDIGTDQPQIADLAQTAADRAEDLARYLRETDAREIVSNVESFARKQPLLFLGGAFVLGVAASRLIKAASGGGSQSGQGRGMYGGETGSYGIGTGATGTTQDYYSGAGTSRNGGDI